MFDAYPRQRWQLFPFRFKPAMLALAAFAICFGVVWLGTSLRPVSSDGFLPLDAKQPFLASEQIEVGPWPRERGGRQEVDRPALQKPEAVPVPRPDLPQERLVAGEASRHPSLRQPNASSTPSTIAPPAANLASEDEETIERLRSQLKVEQARLAAQQAELSRLREIAARVEAAPSTLPPLSPSPARAPPPKAAMPEAAPTTQAQQDKPPVIQVERIPASLWRQPPGEEATTTSTSTTQPAIAPPKVDESPHVTVRTRGGEGGGIVVQIGGTAGNFSPFSAPSSAPSAASASPGGAAAAAAAGVSAAAVATSMSASSSEALAATASAPAAAAAVAVPTAPSEEKAEGRQESKKSRITVKTGDSEISIQFGGDNGDSDGAEEAPLEKRPAAGARAPPGVPSATAAAADGDVAPTTTAAAAPVVAAAPAAATAAASAGAAAASPTTTAGAADAAQESADSSGGAVEGAAAAAAAKPLAAPAPSEVGGGGPGAREERHKAEQSGGKADRGTSITVKSQGKSITIRVRGNEEDDDEKPEAGGGSAEKSAHPSLASPVVGSGTAAASAATSTAAPTAPPTATEAPEVASAPPSASFSSAPAPAAAETETEAPVVHDTPLLPRAALGQASSSAEGSAAPERSAETGPATSPPRDAAAPSDTSGAAATNGGGGGTHLANLAIRAR